MKRKITFFIIIVVILFLFRNELINDKEDLSDKSVTLTNLYINLFDPKSLVNIFYQYNQTSQENKVLLKKDIVDYTAFAFSEHSNSLYFADKAKDNTMQLFVKNLKTNQTKQLTSEVNNVDFIQIDKTETTIFMRVLLKNENRNFHIATYDIETKELKIWDETNTDKSILNFDYNKNNNKLVIASYSQAEDTKKLEEANENQTILLPPKYSIDIYDISGNMEKRITTMEVFISGVSFSPDQEALLLSYDEDLISPLSYVVEIDVNTKKIKPLFNTQSKYSKIRAVKYDEKNEGFFFLSSFKKNKNHYNALEIPEKSVLSYYDLKKNKIKDIWQTNKGVIVNYSY
ncbi:hypothetical protein [Sporosarcina cyprini]|uniref:hypothetical protein n=1 Tax=Sporosarcina cyprini TaxID=2910523 RepID=UPI001EDF9504|nr:hypothetical protein [Sporosarcina cyprini]MCG3086839.1 hypothetical protein [Sporosarcina cyprini]